MRVGWAVRINVPRHEMRSGGRDARGPRGRFRQSRPRRRRDRVVPLAPGWGLRRSRARPARCCCRGRAATSPAPSSRSPSVRSRCASGHRASSAPSASGRRSRDTTNLVFSIAYRGSSATSCENGFRSSAISERMNAIPTNGSRTQPTRGSMTPPLPSPPMTASVVAHQLDHVRLAHRGAVALAAGRGGNVLAHSRRGHVDRPPGRTAAAIGTSPRARASLPR